MRKKLETMSKDQLIERFMKAKVFQASLSTSLRLLTIWQARAGYDSDSSLENSDVEVVVKRDVQENSSSRKVNKKAEPTPEKAESAPKEAEAAPQKAEPVAEKAEWDTTKQEPAGVMSKMEW